MKWAIFSPGYPPECVGGNTIYAQSFGTALVASGHEVHIFSPTQHANTPSICSENGVTIHRIPTPGGLGGPLRFGSASCITKYFLAIDEQVHFDVVNPNATCQLRYGRLRRGLAILHTFHASITLEYLFKIRKIIASMDFFSAQSLREIATLPLKLPITFLREWRALAKADSILVMSRYVANYLHRLFPWIHSDRVSVSRIGVDFKRFAPMGDKAAMRAALGIPAGKIALLTVRRLDSRMGLEQLIDACDLLMRLPDTQPFVVLIAGSGPARPALERRIRDRKLEHIISLLGFVEDDRLQQCYAAADAFVLPTEALEGFGIVSIEAFSYNLPVIATPVGANPEVAGRYCPELLSESATAAALAERIQYFFKHHGEYTIRNYRALVQSDYDWTSVATELETLVKGVLSR